MKEYLPGRGERLLSVLFPARCLWCGKLTPGGADVCPRCRPLLPGEPRIRELTLPSGKALTVRAPFSYEGGVRDALHRLKFQEERALCHPLGRFMAGAVENAPFDAVTWVPMSAAKRRKRGYNQTELLARQVGKLLGVPPLELLATLRETATQHDLPREERFANVAGAYRALPQAAGQRLLLVDDIVTTGATLRQCAQALLDAGAAAVTGLCAASAEIEPSETEETP